MYCGSSRDIDGLEFFSERTIFAQVDDYELQDYRLNREMITEVVKESKRRLIRRNVSALIL
jgi:hypothetical protein